MENDNFRLLLAKIIIFRYILKVLTHHANFLLKIIFIYTYLYYYKVLANYWKLGQTAMDWINTKVPSVCMTR